MTGLYSIAIVGRLFQWPIMSKFLGQQDFTTVSSHHIRYLGANCKYADHWHCYDSRGCFGYCVIRRWLR